jgi:circadian clock protein KaiB
MASLLTKRNRQPQAVVQWDLCLYVAGSTLKSAIAFRNLERVCEEHLAGRYRIEMVDLTKNPQLARADNILALPALVRKRPSPICKLIGSLSDTERVLASLNLRPGLDQPAWGAYRILARLAWGPTIPTSAIELNNLALLLQATNRLSERRTVGSESRRNIPSIYRRHGREQSALQLLEEAYRNFRRVSQLCPSVHPGSISFSDPIPRVFSSDRLI